MGIACRINRSAQGTPVSVEAQNGQESGLFREILRRVGVQNLDRDPELDKDAREEGLQLWLASQSKKFFDLVKGPQLRKYRSTLAARLAKIDVETPTVEMDVNGTTQRVNIGNPEFTNLNNTLVAFGRVIKEDGTDGEAVRLGRIRYKTVGNEIVIDSSLVTPDVRGNGVGSRMYAELFKIALKQDKNLMSSDNLGPNSRPLWERMVNMDMARRVGERYMLNNFPPSYDENGEPSASAVIDFVDRLSYDEALSLQDEIDIANALIGTNAISSADAIAKLRAGFKPDGSFAPTQESLRRTNFYTQEEITDILSNQELQERIKDMIYKLEKWDTEANPIIPNESADSRDLWVVKDGTKNALGKYRLQNPHLVERMLVDELGGIETREEFEAALNNSELADVAIPLYRRNYETANDLFWKLREYKPVAEATISEDGQLVPKTTRTKQTLEQTLKVIDTEAVERNTDFLIALDNEVWQTAPEQVTTLLNKVADDMIEFGMDTTSLVKQAKSKGVVATKDFLRALNNYSIAANDTTFNDLVEAYDTFFDVDNSFKFTKMRLPLGTNPGNLFMVKTELSGPELFFSQGLVPIGQGVYKRVNPDITVDQFIDAFYNYAIANNGYKSMLDPKAFYPAVADINGVIDYAALQDQANAEQVKQSMRDYVEAQVGKLYLEGMDQIDPEVMSQYVLNYVYYNSSENFTQHDVKVPMNSEMMLMATPVTGTRENYQDYLRSEFASDFYVKALKEKKKNSAAYSNFYSNFEFDEAGIRLVSDDPISMRNMKPYLEENKDLVNYFRIRKDLPDLVEPDTIVDYVVDDIFKRNYYSNYPTALKPFTGSFTRVSQNTIVADTKAPFIRTNEGIYEFAETTGNKTAYTRVFTNRGPFKNYDTAMQPLEPEYPGYESLMDFERAVATGETITRNDLYTKEEKDQIDNNYDNC